MNFKGAVSSRNSIINVGNNLQSISVGNDSADEVKDKIPLSSNAGSGDHSTFHAEVNDINDNVMRKTGKSDVPKYNCEYCEFKSKYWNSLKMHSDEHHKNKNFKCKKCDFESTNLLNIKNHNKHMHIGEGNLVCKNCGFRATSVRKMTWHENRVHKKVTRLFKEGKKANSDSGDHPNPTSTEIKNTNKSKVKQIGKTKSGIAASILDAKSVVASANQESPSKSKKVLRANDVEILSETSSLYMDILNTRLDKEDLSTIVKTEKKITPTPKSKREKVQVIYEADGAHVVRNYEDLEGSLDKDIDALLKDATVLLEECPEVDYYQTFPQSRRIRTIVSENDIRTTCVIDEDWNEEMELVNSRKCNASPTPAPKRRKDSGFFSRTSVLGDSNVRPKLRRDCRGSCSLCGNEFSKKELFQHAARCRGDI